MKNLAFGGLLLLASVGAARDLRYEVSRYRYATPVVLPEKGLAEPVLADVVLPAEAVAAARDDLADIRVIRADSGEAVPFTVGTVNETCWRQVRRPVSLRLTRAETLEGGRLRVTLERRDAAEHEVPPLSGVTLRTPQRDYERKVTVECSRTGEAWEEAARDVGILDLSSHADFRSNDILLPSGSSHRYLRLTIDRMDEVRVAPGSSVTTSSDGDGQVRSVTRSIWQANQPFRVNGVDGWYEETVAAGETNRLTDRSLHMSAEVPAELRRRFPEARLLCFDAGRVPLTRLSTRSDKAILSLPFLLFERDGRRQTEAGAAEWRQIASGHLARTVFREFRQEQMEIAFPESRAAAYCLVLTDREGAADLALSGGRGPLHHVVFPCGAGQSYMLLAGFSECPGPAGYQDGQIRLLARHYPPLTAGLDGWRENPVWRKRGRRFGDAELTWALSAAVVLVAIVLGGAVVCALKRVQEAPPPA